MYSQGKNEIEFPEIDSKLKFLVIPYHSIFVNKNGEIFFGDDKIEIQEVKEKIYGSYYNHNGYDDITMYPTEVHLFADKNVEYSIIDKIKTEIAQTNCTQKLIYRSNFEMKKQTEMYGLSHKLPNSYYKFLPPERILTKEEKVERRNNLKRDKQLGFPEPPSSNMDDWNIISSEVVIYTIQEPVIKEFFENKRAVIMKVGNDAFEVDDIKLSFIEVDQLKSFFKNYDIIIFDFNTNIKYTEYIDFLKTIIPIEKSMNQIQFVEYSSKIKLLHKKAKIDLQSIIR